MSNRVLHRAVWHGRKLGWNERKNRWNLGEHGNGISSMIVIAKKFGQLGNRLFLYGHLIAAAEEYGVPLVNPCFSDYADLFPATKGDIWCQYPRGESISGEPSQFTREATARITSLTARGLGILGGSNRKVEVVRLAGSRQSCDLGSDEFASLVWSKHVLVQGWLFRSERLFKKHREKILEHFAISEQHQRIVDSTLTSIREGADVVVGIHLRQGDYANFMNGKYFFSTSQYAELMHEIARQLSPKRVRFLVCGNGTFDETDFPGLSVCCGAGGVIEDLYSFAGVDLLVGPPSTFTGWASFYGNVPLYSIDSMEESPDFGEKLQGRSGLAA
ncbi:hypothetical protein OAF09_01535 [bacterium]|nr:hypothetical protein [bacterium]